MKLRILLAVVGLSFIALSARADQFDFQPSRVESVEFTSTKDGARIVAKVYDKVTNTDAVQFKIELKKKGDNVYVSPKGTTFTLKHLSAPRNAGKTIDSGDWELRVSGSGEEFQQIRDSANEDSDSTESEAIFTGSKKK